MCYYSFSVLGSAGIVKKKPFAFREFLDTRGFDYYETVKFKHILHPAGVNIRPITLNEKSSEVDFIFGLVEIGGTGFIISERIIKVLKEYVLPPNRTHDVTVLLNGKVTDVKYKWIQFIVYDISSKIDFSSSEILVKDVNEKIQSYDAFVQANKIPKKKLVFCKLNFMQNAEIFDLFYIPQFKQNYTFAISERLKERLVNEKVTGLREFEI